MTSEQIEAIKARHQAASDEVTAQCNDKGWRMCIPVQPTDSDVVITRSLNDIPDLLAALTAMRHDLDSTYGLYAMDKPIENPDAFQILHGSLTS